MTTPLAVLISDIHFSVQTLSLASVSLRRARSRASELGVPLIVAGDLIDGKAILRGEVANALIEILTDKEDAPVWTYVIVGNHDRINEKDAAHSLNFLKAYTGITVVDSPYYELSVDAWLIPYTHDTDGLKKQLDLIKAGSRIIMHQGLMTAKMGHYVVDKTSLEKEVFKDYRVISGHYHIPQDIKCGRARKGSVGLFSYIGSPYTQSFSEAAGPARGYAVLNDDGTLTRESIGLREHMIVELDYKELDRARGLKPDTILWLRVTGPESELRKLDKVAIGEIILGHSNYKLELIPTEGEKVKAEPEKKLTGPELLDKIIDSSGETEEQKAYLKSLYREIV